MSYMDDQKDKDYSVDEKAYNTSGSQTTQTNSSVEKENTNNGSKKPAKSLFGRMRDLITGGGDHVKNSIKGGHAKWKSEGGLFSAKTLLKTMNPKKLAITAVLGGTGVFSIFGLFTSYKNDGAIKEDKPYECETGFIALPEGGDDENDIQENVNIMYDIFVNEMGYSEEFLVGLTASIMVESSVDPTRLESDFIMKSQHQAFLAVAGPDKPTKSGPAYSAFQTYANAFKTQGGWNGNSGYFCGSGCELCGGGQMTCGIGLIQWTGGRAHNLILGLDKIKQDYSVTSLPYQCAFMMAEIYDAFPDKFDPESGEWKSNCGDDVSATKFVFRWLIAGGGEGTGVSKRTDNAPIARQYVDKAAANGKFTRDTVDMIDLLTEDEINTGVAATQQSELCVNGTVINPSSIAMAAVSMSWLEKGEYANEAEAYLMIRRSARSPILINDWDYLEGMDNACDISDEAHAKLNADGSITVNKGHGMHDLIACTEFYYFAHLLVLPTETGQSSAGYFASCDRGACTSVRVAGADDNYPAGNPDTQLSYMLGKQHNAKDNLLWEPTGFLRGCDFYDFGGSTSITSSSLMCTWENAAANGLLSSSEGNASVDGGAPNEYDEIASGKMSLMNLRFPLSKTTTHNHIIVAVGEGTVQSYYGMDFLYQQYRMFSDADSLVRGDLTIEAPEDMTAGLAYKAKTANKSTDKETTFWKEENEGAKTHDDESVSEITERNTEFNAKTGLPAFKAWEQIFVRLIHNSDDDASTGHGGLGNDIYIKYQTDEDNFLDGQTDKIENYMGDTYTNTNKTFYETYNSVGGGTVQSGGTGDYDAVGTDSLLYYDDGTDKWTQSYGSYGQTAKYWRYEYITDVEYRVNQIMRFGMAAGMCSYASEEDANIFQDGVGDNDGHIIGNIYRRNSRISDDIDKSGRYYYYNTVVSNDMLQDLTQLYTIDANDPNGGKHPNDNFGPKFDLSEYYEGAKSFYQDRRYGLTAQDIEFIMGLSLGNDGFNSKMNQYMFTPMYEMSEPEKALYDKEGGTSTTDGKGSHEGTHTPNPSSNVYGGDIYGLNPFLMLDKTLGRSLVNIPEDNGSYRTGIAAGFNTDSYMAFIDRHFYTDSQGNVNMYAYSVFGMKPSIGIETSSGSYKSALQKSKTLNTEPKTNTNGYHDTLFGSWGELRYTDYIYAESTTENNNNTRNETDMAKRLYGDDDRNDDGIRDDYNRREYIVIPYYHTHIQACDHDPRLEDIEFDLKCQWCDDNAKIMDGDNRYRTLDSQTWLNDACGDHLTTTCFENGIDARGKYPGLSGELSRLPMGSKVYYYLDDGTPLNNGLSKPHMSRINQFYAPDVHVICDGYTFSVDADATSSATCPYPGCGNVVAPGGSCTHSCEECLSDAFKHDHVECMEGSYCHDCYGCNPAEYYYHGGKDDSGKTHKVYMVIQVIKHPKEKWGTDISIHDWTVTDPSMRTGRRIIPDKANILQAITFDAHGYIVSTGYELMKILGKPLKCFRALKYVDNPGSNYGSGTLIAYSPDPLIGYFTVEGNVIKTGVSGNKDGETVTSMNKCGKEDLIRVESIRNRVGDGKPGQSMGFITGVSSVKYDSVSRDHGTTSNGYGEYQVVGSQHQLPPTADQGNYGGGFHGDGIGPDGVNGNEALRFGNSLLRHILGNSHVFHIRYGTQEPPNPDYYDYTVYDEFIDLDEDKKYVDNYTNEVTTEELDKYEEPNKELDKYHANGDYALWVTHSSRGDRGLKTAYWNVKNNCGDPYLKGTFEEDKNMQYMIFSNETAQDTKDVDGDQNRDESFIYYMGGKGGTVPSGAVNLDDGIVYGQGGNSHWKHLVDLYNAAMSETRQFD